MDIVKILLISLFFSFPITLQARDALDYTVCIQPINPYTHSHIADMERGIKELYGFDTEVLLEVNLPASIFPEAPLYRLRVEPILIYLIDEMPVRCDFIVGFFDLDIIIADIVTGKIKGIFGVANFGSLASLVSTYKMHLLLGEEIQNFLVKTTNHEIGHMVGIPHHDDPKCMMKQWEKGLDHNSQFLCKDTRDRIETILEINLPSESHDDLDSSLVTED